MNREDFRRVKRHIISWGTGTALTPAPRVGTVATIAISDREHLAAVFESGLAGPGTVVLAPGEHDDLAGVVGYGGSLAEIGADLSIGDDFYLQTQDYASSAFMSVLGPTLIQVTDGDDFSSFLTDVDRALVEGVFPDFAIAPSVFIADLPALGAGPGSDGPGLRLYVNPQGVISTSPNGSPLGKVGAPLAELIEAWERINAASLLPCGVCLGAVVPDADRVPALASRPFVGRYLTAVDALRMMTANEIGGVRVSGFGGRLTPGLTVEGDARDLLDPTAPAVLWNADHAYVFQPGGRMFAVDQVSAKAVECLLVAGPAAADFVPPRVIAKVERFFTERGVPLVDNSVALGVR